MPQPCSALPYQFNELIFSDGLSSMQVLEPSGGDNWNIHSESMPFSGPVLLGEDAEQSIWDMVQQHF